MNNNITTNVLSYLGIDDVCEENIHDLDDLLETVLDGAENNSWILLKKGTYDRDQDPEDTCYWRVGHEFENTVNAIDERIKLHDFPSGSVLLTIRRELSREIGEEDIYTEGLSEKYAHKFEFILVDKTIKRKLTAYDVVRNLDKSEINSLNKLLKKRYAHNKECRKYREWDAAAMA